MLRNEASEAAYIILLREKIESYLKGMCFIFPRCYYVYLITNQYKSVLYTGVTNDLKQRITEHNLQRGHQASFTSKHHAYWLLYFEDTQYITNAIAGEKERKGWATQNKMDLINTVNP